jgi:hypothetical protein
MEIERLTFCGVDGVRCRRSGHRLAVRVGCDAAHDTDTPTCVVEVLGDLGIDVLPTRRQACLRSVGRCLEARSCRRWRCRLGSRWSCGWWSSGRQPAAPKLPLESADGDEAESVRARLRERVSSPCGDNGGCVAVLRPSRCDLSNLKVATDTTCDCCWEFVLQTPPGGV